MKSSAVKNLKFKKICKFSTQFLWIHSVRLENNEFEILIVFKLIAGAATFPRKKVIIMKSIKKSHIRIVVLILWRAMIKLTKYAIKKL